DFGADGVVIPHILGVDHARTVAEFAKFAPLGDRSYAGGRTVEYGGPDDEWPARQNAATSCYPMIEDRRALEDVEAIVALDAVDGICMGMSDLSLSRGRGRYRHTDADWADLAAAAEAARRVNKRWILPAWNEAEQERACQLGASHMVVAMEFAALREGLEGTLHRAEWVIGRA
ncbi:MAG TPA: aldolase/citrate lyase family protein, partial [Vicinamibacterales bacterium]|nr:aldolase/citrate lyase family protein [Vicinamibacterales bacterium]